jgi:hypothetical protein
LQNSFEIIIDFINHYDESIRRMTVITLRQFITSLIHKDITDEQGEYLDKIINITVYLFNNSLLQDDDKETVARICENYSLLLKLLGKKFLNEEQLKLATNALCKLLERKGNCNKQILEEEDHDMVLIDAVSVNIFSKNLGYNRSINYNIWTIF